MIEIKTGTSSQAKNEVSDSFHRHVYMLMNKTMVHLSAFYQNAEVLIELAHLKSYENMGKASVACRGCTCNPSVIDGHWTDRSSQTQLHGFHSSRAVECLITVTGEIAIK
jgi:hypothetical protein